MNVLFYVFSGTGNTLKCCERLASFLTEYGFGCEIRKIEVSDEVVSTEGFDILIPAYPVHAFNAPAPVNEFLKRLPQGSGMTTYLLRCSGEPLKLNDASGITPKRILGKKGYDVFGEFSFVMPYNIIFRHSDEMAARMWRAAGFRAEKAAKIIAEKQRVKTKVGVFSRCVSFVLKIEHPAMPLIGRRFSVTENCTGCGVCAKLCPQKNIFITDGKPHFGKSCVGCMACSFDCPRDAIRISVLNGWRVNGRYDFSGKPAADDEVCSYCKNAYLKYFHNSEPE